MAASAPIHVAHTCGCIGPRNVLGAGLCPTHGRTYVLGVELLRNALERRAFGTDPSLPPGPRPSTVARCHGCLVALPARDAAEGVTLCAGCAAEEP